jgi:hypothetical protein
MKELIEIQNELKVLKDQTKEGIKFKYRTCDQIFGEVKPLCKEKGVLLVVSDSIEHHGDRYYIKATATVSKDNVSISASAFAREPDKLMTMSYPQITGSCSSYARKYAMGGLFNLDNNEDPDTIDNRVTVKQKAQFRDFEAQFKKDNDQGALAKLAPYLNNSELTETEAHNAIININTYIEGKK